jgi:hypothetical protein
MKLTNTFITDLITGYNRGKNRAKNIHVQKSNGSWTKVNIMGYIMINKLNKADYE